MKSSKISLLFLAINVESVIMENFDEQCKKKNALEKSKNPSSGNGCGVREASNVIILVRNNSKAGKCSLMLWYIEHINKTVAIGKTKVLLHQYYQT